MKSLALIGYPLSHSFSQKYFEEKFSQLSLPDWKYELLPLENLKGLTELVNQRVDLLGFNVTIPHKINIIPFCDDLSEEAESIGAVNCVQIERGSGAPELIGYNTDAYGFEKSLFGWYKPTMKKAMVYGDGGAAKAVKYVLAKLHIAFTEVVRNVKNDKQIPMEEVNAELFAAHDLIINCTPVGMYPDIDGLLKIDTSWIKPSQYYYDLVYNPEETVTMKLFAKQGASVKNGMEMLYLQADKAWEIWTNDAD